MSEKERKKIEKGYDTVARERERERERRLF